MCENVTLFAFCIPTTTVSAYATAKNGTTILNINNAPIVNGEKTDKKHLKDDTLKVFSEAMFPVPKKPTSIRTTTIKARIHSIDGNED